MGGVWPNNFQSALHIDCISPSKLAILVAPVISRSIKLVEIECPRTAVDGYHDCVLRIGPWYFPRLVSVYGILCTIAGDRGPRLAPIIDHQGDGFRARAKRKGKADEES